MIECEDSALFRLAAFAVSSLFQLASPNGARICMYNPTLHVDIRHYSLLLCARAALLSVCYVWHSECVFAMPSPYGDRALLTPSRVHAVICARDIRDVSLRLPIHLHIFRVARE